MYRIERVYLNMEKIFKRKYIWLILVLALICITAGASYAYFTALGLSDEQVVQSGVLSLTYTSGENILLENIVPTEETGAGIHEFTIENTGTLDATYYLYLDKITLQKNGEDTQSENLKWKLYSADESYIQQGEIASGSFAEGDNTIELDTDIAIAPKEKHYYILKIWLQETGELQNEDQGLEFSTVVEATTDRKTINKMLVNVIKDEAVLDNIASEFVTSSTGINFSQVSSDTNGKGLYILNGTENNPYPIMYYRGDVKNNNVKFANYCWKMVRTTETGGIKLIYNGKPDSSGQCSATGSATVIQDSVFNTNYNDNAYVGYMYGTAGSSDYQEAHKNVNDSTIKTVIDEWYSQNMIEYADQLEDTVWCNDRSVVPDSSYPGTGVGKEKTMYGARNRLYSTKTPTLECVNENDRFTVSEENGNGALTYPIALLTADEIAYAGSVYNQNNRSYYLYNNDWWWSMSPFYFNGTNMDELIVYSTGSLYGVNGVGLTFGIRPAVSLKRGTKVIGNGDGTVENPYVVVE